MVQSRLLHSPSSPSLGWRDAVRDLYDSLFDLARLPMAAPALSRVPRADGHAVLVLPGFLSSDHPTWPLRAYLASIGYRAHAWELGINLGFSSKYAYDIEDLVEHRLKEVFLASGERKISLVGWSLGGLYAKVLAQRYPGLVRDVITLGSPISGDITRVGPWRLYEAISGMRAGDPGFARKLKAMTAPLEGVPLTAIYNRRDGVVGPENARVAEGPLAQNIDVPAAHGALGFDGFVMYLVAQRLAASARPPWRALDVAALRRCFEADCAGRLAWNA
ncbi:MAG: alpha/beta hydrolase [Pseudomonadota bacterium]